MFNKQFIIAITQYLTMTRDVRMMKITSNAYLLRDLVCFSAFQWLLLCSSFPYMLSLNFMLCSLTAKMKWMFHFLCSLSSEEMVIYLKAALL